MLFILTFLVVAKLCNLLLVLIDEKSCFKKVVSSYCLSFFSNIIQIRLLIWTYSIIICILQLHVQQMHCIITFKNRDLKKNQPITFIRKSYPLLWSIGSNIYTFCLTSCPKTISKKGFKSYYMYHRSFLLITVKYFFCLT